MSYTAIELYDSRNYDYSLAGDSTMTRRWRVGGTEDEVALHNWLAANLIPLFFLGCTLRNYTANHEGNGWWLVEANYQAGVRTGIVNPTGGPGGTPDTVTPRTGGAPMAGHANLYPAFKFETTGGTRNITQSEGTNTHVVPGFAAPPAGLGRTIGWRQEDNSIDGVDVVVPERRFEETHYLPTSMVTTNYIKTLSDFTGSVNSDPFRGYAAGEVLFVGASGSLKNLEAWEITYQFKVSPNKPSRVIDGFTIPAHNGWDYLELVYTNAVQNGQLFPRLWMARIHVVYHYWDFSELKIGM